jgi:hypothetical protein
MTLQEGEERETWHAAGNDTLERVKSSPQAQWPFGAGELIQRTEKVVKVRQQL